MESSVPVRWRVFENNRPGRWTAKTVYPHFVGRSGVARLANTVIGKESRKDLDVFIADAKGLPSDSSASGRLFFESKATVSTALHDLVSVFMQPEFYTGGAHGYRSFHVYNFGLVEWKPKRLKLQDLFRPNTDSRKVMSDLVIPKLKAMGASSVVDGAYTKLSKEHAEMFVVTPNGVTFLFAPYEVGSYAEGAYIVKVPYSEFKDRCDPDGPLQPFLKGR